MEKYPGLKSNPEFTQKSFPRIYKLNDSFELDNTIFVGDSEEVKTGDTLLSQQNDCVTSYSYGANPCVSGMVQTTDQKIYLFHSLGDRLTSEQEDIINRCQKGIVGGGLTTLKKYSSYFKEHHVKTLNSPGNQYYFSFVLIKSKNQFKVPVGFYYLYEDDY